MTTPTHPTGPSGPTPATRRGLRGYFDDLGAEIIALPTADLAGQSAQSLLWGIGVALASTYALSQPLLDYCDPVYLALTGLLIGISVLALDAIWLRKGGIRYCFLAISIFSMISAAAVLTCQVLEASQLSRVNDNRCTLIQNDMLRSSPIRKDSPALFQALKCSPSGFRRVDFAPI